MWLLLESVRREMDAARKAGFVLSDEQVTELKVASRDNGKMQIVGREAVIPVEGVLTEKRDWFAAWFGGGNTTYPDIKQAIAEANGSPEIDGITMVYGYTPGGNVTGLFPTMDAIRDSSKPVKAVVRSGAMSAAYGLASQAGELVADNRGTMLGSVGVAMDTFVYTGGGVEEVSIASTEAPDKRPNLLTEEGKAVVRKELDAIHEPFVESIAAGRKTTAKKVNANFGRGAVVLAEQALESGMIDSIGLPQTQSATAAATTKEVGSMDLKTLMAEHPAVYAEAVEVGKAEERDRVGAHLKMAEASGDMDTAVKAIGDGSGMTATLLATYSAAGMNRNAVAARTGDNAELNLEPEAQGGDSLDELVAKEMGKLEGDQDEVIHG